jgi:hypothetical protein
MEALGIQKVGKEAPGTVAQGTQKAQETVCEQLKGPLQGMAAPGMEALESQEEGTAAQGTQMVLGTVCEQLQGSMAPGLAVEAR